VRASTLLALGCLACGARSLGTDAPDSTSAPVSASASPPTSGDTWPLVRLLASDALEGRAPGSEGSRLARAAIVAELQRCNVATPSARTSYEQPTDGPGINVVGHLPGSEAGRYIVLSAHYDHLGRIGDDVMNGADDNAAAVGSVLAVACALAHRPHRATLVIALWDTEEPPHFLSDTMGSRFWVEHPHIPLAQIEAAIVLDLVGGGLWPGSPIHVALGAESSPQLAAAVDRTPVPAGLVVAQAGLHLVEELVTGGHQPWSDYDAFRSARVPHLFLSNGQTEHYHTASDDFATLDLAKLTRQTTWLTDLVAHLLDLDQAAAPRWAPFDRPEVDRAAARQLVAGALASGGFDAGKHALTADLERLTASPEDNRAERTAVQRVQCLAAKHYPTALCLQLGSHGRPFGPSAGGSR